MKVFIIGLSFFCKKIKTNLEIFDQVNEYYFIERNGRIVTFFKYFLNLLNSDVVYVIGGAVTTGLTLRIALLLNKKIIMHWVGSDVLVAARIIHNGGVYNKKLTSISKHLCEVEWIKTELLDIGIHSEIKSIASFNFKENTNSIMPDKFSVLTYIAKDREKFYGFDKILAVAKRRPDINFRVAGISEYTGNLTKNIKLLGWVNNMEKEYKECVVYLRLPEHDGLAFSVLEALKHGRYVGYTYSIHGCEKITSHEDLENYIDLIHEEFSNNNLEINYKGISYVRKNYNFEKVMLELKNYLINDNGYVDQNI